MDALIGNAISKTLQSAMPIRVPFLSEYPDFFAFAVVMLLIILLSVGVKESSILNNIFTVINLITIIIIVVAGSIKGNRPLPFYRLELILRCKRSFSTVPLKLFKFGKDSLYWYLERSEFLFKSTVHRIIMFRNSVPLTE